MKTRQGNNILNMNTYDDQSMNEDSYQNKSNFNL